MGYRAFVSGRDGATYSGVEDFRFFDRLLVVGFIEMIDGEVIGSTQIRDQRSIKNGWVRISGGQEVLPIVAIDQNGTGACFYIRTHLIGHCQTGFARCVME